ncbi:hypothetical protein QJQ45_000962 [Haematococcus lacustris]|nr:hypothetical protein QJQ45_000962 [Haematococcus lacustris]
MPLRLQAPALWRALHDLVIVHTASYAARQPGPALGQLWTCIAEEQVDGLGALQCQAEEDCERGRGIPPAAMRVVLHQLQQWGCPEALLLSLRQDLRKASTASTNASSEVQVHSQVPPPSATRHLLLALGWLVYQGRVFEQQLAAEGQALNPWLDLLPPFTQAAPLTAYELHLALHPALLGQHQTALAAATQALAGQQATAAAATLFFQVVASSTPPSAKVMGGSSMLQSLSSLPASNCPTAARLLSHLDTQLRRALKAAQPAIASHASSQRLAMYSAPQSHSPAQETTLDLSHFHAMAAAALGPLLAALTQAPSDSSATATALTLKRASSCRYVTRVGGQGPCTAGGLQPVDRQEPWRGAGLGLGVGQEAQGVGSVEEETGRLVASTLSVARMLARTRAAHKQAMKGIADQLPDSFLVTGL